MEVIDHDCPGLRLRVFGDYKYNRGRISFIFRVVLPRIIKLYRYIKKERFDLVITANYQANMAARFLGIPNVGFNDDPEKINLTILKRFGDRVYLPVFAENWKRRNHVKVFHALKEWAYLSPRYFSPDESVLAEYGLQAKEYLFAREVSTKSLNYLRQQEGTILAASEGIPKDVPVVLSLEEKSLESRYPGHWHVLREPVRDIHSLMYYSRMVLSSGDSMAREGAMLGVPSIYCGIRDMAANGVLMEKNMLFKVPPADVPAFVGSKMTMDTGRERLEQERFRTDLHNQWQDVTELIVSLPGRVKELRKRSA